MRIFLLPTFIIVTLLAGCATSIIETRDRPSAFGKNETRIDASTFEVRQYYLYHSEMEANMMAQNRCSLQNSAPKLIDFTKGCLLFCGSEYSYYRYECISNKAIAEDRQTYDTNSCLGWGFTRGTEGFANCMMRLYEVRIAVDNAATTNREIRNMTEQQRRNAEREQAQRMLNLSNQIQQQSRPQSITPFSCNKIGDFVTCR